jgi:hypothetical protein
MKRNALPALVLGVVIVCAPARFALATQVDDAQIASSLDQLAAMLGLAPVDADELERRVEQIGGLTFRTKVPINFMSREELGRYIRELFSEEYPVEYARREERALRAFGFLNDNQDLREIRERVLNENIAGFYDERPGVKKLFAISSGQTLNLMNQLILAHELRHAVQDQHVVIREQLRVDSDFDDRRLAALCLIEGDASLLMEQYLTSGVTRNAPELANLFQAFSQGMSGPEVAQMLAGPALQGAPAVVQEQLVAPYFQGRNLALAVYEKGGFALLNESLARLPRSMEQVLHPEKYLDGSDEPIEVALPEVRGRDVDFEGRLGELLIRVLLSGGASDATAATAAEGWGGDSYAVYADSGSYALVWRSVWDTRTDAREFEASLAAHMDARLGGADYGIEASGREVVFTRMGLH